MTELQWTRVAKNHHVRYVARLGLFDLAIFEGAPLQWDIIDDRTGHQLAEGVFREATLSQAQCAVEALARALMEPTP